MLFRRVFKSKQSNIYQELHVKANKKVLFLFFLGISLLHSIMADGAPPQEDPPPPAADLADGAQADLQIAPEAGEDDLNMEVDPAPVEDKIVVPVLAKTDSHIMRTIDSQKKVKKDISFPDTLEGFKYHFNEEGQLRNIETGESFSFNVRSDNSYNQKRYEALGEIITEYVFNLLETEVGLKKVYLPIGAKENDPKSFFFTSEDAMTNSDKLLILIHGSGVVRAGQWARRLIINDCLDSGTQLPYIKRAMQDGYGIMVMNTNYNTISRDKEEVPIKYNSSPEEHASYVWEQFVSKAQAKHIAIVAHSYGGIVTVDLGIKQEKDFHEKVFAIAFTDSVHNLKHQEVPKSVFNFFVQNARNWVSSDQPLDEPVKCFFEDLPRVSAGHPKHEVTSWSAFDSVFQFISEKYQEKSKDEKEIESPEKEGSRLKKEELKEEIKQEL